MTRFYTADLHLGHANIIEYTGRPFADVDEMNYTLIDNWNSVVGRNDEVIVLGDMVLGKLSETLPLVGLLNGRKVLLAGNHDRCWVGGTGKRKASPAAIQRYLDAGFDEIWQGVVFLRVCNKHDVLACHFPYIGDSHDRDRFDEYRPKDTGLYLLHGHVHTAWQVRDRMINVGTDMWQFCPVAEEQLAEIISA